ncbi:transcription termination factor 3, mitochondrial [Nasonia vitripennis]|uniref:mTERF domain-containing protein 1, mitochondrial n=1 Tax=Nasonia vitripennis TaxID=7425 RepID=A0A7M7H8T9_NASVI|nr:transcription termination factor 3, mitochondrial [Nasonia vitripennis]
MSFSRCKALLRLVNISQRNAEFNHDVSQRFYCKKIIFSSASPNELKIKPEKQENEEAKSDKRMRRRRQFRLQETSNYLCTENDQTFKDAKPLNRFSESKEINSYECDRLQDEEERQIVKLEPVSNAPNSENLTVLAPAETEVLDRESSAENKEVARYKFMETPQGTIKYDLSSDEFNIDKYIKEFNASIPGPLDECNEDISDFGPSFPPTFNFAAYADKSVLIQEYVKLGVKLYKIEKDQDHMRALLSVDLEKELPIYIQFLHDCGVPADSLGDVITESPMVLKEDLDDMKTRVRYLRAHNFAVQSIARIVTKNPSWLLWATKKIDERLGHFQNEFKLNGPEVRFLATKQPKLITYNFKHIRENTFAIREEMGFSRQEMKLLLLDKPRLWMNTRKKIVDTFDYLHNTMKLSHLMIASQSDALTCRKSRIKNRHEFLVELNKVQYDPTKPGYIAPKSIAVGSDEEFCRDIAKTAVETYNLFLKTR